MRFSSFVPIFTVLGIVGFCAICAAEDVVRLRSGGALSGRVTAETKDEVVLAMASGEIRIPRSEVESVERNRADTKSVTRKIRRDEWFFLLKEERVVGWRRLLHWELGDRIQVEERRAMFADRSDRRRVEIARKDGTPLEYLWISSSPGNMQVWSGRIEDGQHVRQTRKDGVIKTKVAPWQSGVQLPLIARAGAPVFDPKHNRVQNVVDTKVKPGENWAGRILPTTRARVLRATQLFARSDLSKVAQDATIHPLTPRPEDRVVHHLAGGVALTVPHARWIETKTMRSEGAILSVENRITFARLEVETSRVRGQTIAAASRRARTKITMLYDHVGALGDPAIEGKISLQRFELRRGSERWQAILRIEVRGERTIAVLALAPVRIWAAEKASLEAMLASVLATD